MLYHLVFRRLEKCGHCLRNYSFLRILSFLGMILISSNCTESFDFPDGNVTDNRTIITGILENNELIQLRLSNFFVKEEIEQNRYTVIVKENGIFFDSLIYSGKNIYSSSDSVIVPTLGNKYIVQIFEKAESIFISDTLFFPQEITTKDSRFIDTIYISENSVNYKVRGVIKFDSDQKFNYIAGKLEITYEGFHFITYEDTSYLTRDTFSSQRGISIDPLINCSFPVSYYPFEYYSSTNLSCHNPFIDSLIYTSEHLSQQETLLKVVVNICNLSDEVADYYSTIPTFSEDTDFFYAPQNIVKFNVNSKKVVGLLSTITCIKVSTRIK